MIPWLIYQALSSLPDLLQPLPWRVKFWIILHIDYILASLWGSAGLLLFWSTFWDNE